MLNTRAREVNRFWRVALQHLEVSEFLVRQTRLARDSYQAAAAIYLGGYSVECGLKALWLSQCPERQHGSYGEKLKELGHNLPGIIGSMRTRFGLVLPQEVFELMRRRIIPMWDVNARYRPGKRRSSDAVEFLAAVRRLLDWMGSKR